jgi:hydroxymethylglutaryl-CoA lyase
MQALCQKHHKQLVVYLSMGFGNPYGDVWDVEVVQKWVDILADMDIKILSLSDTIGVADAATINYLFSNLIPPYPDVEFGAHFHTTANTWYEKIDAAYKNGCKRFDGALKGYGGCPMAKDDLTGNMPTENLLYYFKEQQVALHLNETAFETAMQMAVADVFPQKLLH